MLSDYESDPDDVEAEKREINDDGDPDYTTPKEDISDESSSSGKNEKQYYLAVKI